MKQDRIIQKQFRPEIEGVRAVAALLVAIYHIWLGRVSGGVDVFFIVSGFLITTSLLSSYEKNGTIILSNYYLNLSRRLFPLGFSVLLLVTITSYFYLPKVRWSETIKELIASSFYFENWQLAINSIDYLAQNNEASPVQHFWAMSLQGQFYVVWPFVILLTIFLSKYVFKKSLKKVTISIFVFLFIISISYSIYKTYTNQSWAYYDTFARLWEFSLGGILALLISNINIKKHLALILGWFGLFMIVSTGILFSVSTVFPGFVALYPTLGAVFIILSGSNGGKFGVNRLLGSKLLISLGSVSYGIYLFHWPILIFYHILSQRTEVPISHGLIILIVSIALSYLFTNIIEKPIRRIPIVGNQKKLSTIVVICIAPMLVSIGIWKLTLEQTESVYQHIDILEDYPGALVLHPDYNGETIKNIEIKPDPLIARKDLPDSYPDQCHQKQGNSEVVRCDYGEINNPEFTIAIVGGSHSAQWLPTFQVFAEDERIKIINLTKSACRFTNSNDVEEDCVEWNDKIINILEEINPDLVFTIADVGSIQEVPEGYIEQWEKLENLNINVFALRDNGWFNFDPPSCIEENISDYLECSVNQEDLLPEIGAFDQLEIKPTNVYYHDLTDYFCVDGRCDLVIGNILVYRDSHHITATYAETLAPMLRPVVMDILESTEN